MLRRAGDEDLPRLVEIWMEMMRTHHEFEPRMMLSRAAGPAYQSYLTLHCRSAKSIVALDEEEGAGIVAFCCAYMCLNLPMFDPPEFGYISDLVVTPAWQGHGIGTALLDHVTDWFKRYDLKCMQLQVYHHNEKGQQFWRSKGYESFVERLWLDV